MFKTLFLVLILGVLLNNNPANCEVTDPEALRELDDALLFNELSDQELALPDTSKEIYRLWCRPFADKALNIVDLTAEAFNESPLLQMLARLMTMTQLSLTRKFCAQPALVKIVAGFNREINPLLHETWLDWYKMTLNTFLVAAERRSRITGGDLICLRKKLAKRLIEISPPEIAKGLKGMIKYQEKQMSVLVKGILRYLDIDMNETECSIPRVKARNPYGIKSDKLAYLLAWDRVLERHNRNFPLED